MEPAVTGLVQWAGLTAQRAGLVPDGAGSVAQRAGLTDRRGRSYSEQGITWILGSR